MGLQNLDPRFESGCRLQISAKKLKNIGCRDGGIGRRKGLKILRVFTRAGSSPALGTNLRLRGKNVEEELGFGWQASFFKELIEGCPP